MSVSATLHSTTLAFPELSFLTYHFKHIDIRLAKSIQSTQTLPQQDVIYKDGPHLHEAHRNLKQFSHRRR